MQESPSVDSLEATFDSFPDGVFALGMEQKILYYNPVAEKIFGMRRQDWMGKRCNHPVELETSDHPCVAERVLETGESFQQTTAWLKSDNGEKQAVRITAYPLRSSSGALTGSIVLFSQPEIRMERPESKTTSLLMGDKIVGKNPKMQEIYNLLPGLSRTKSTVLIEGESGTGKELIAHALHMNSLRRNKPFVKVNCGALAEGILESELFGHVKGAYTGAISNKQGRFELANEGTMVAVVPEKRAETVLAIMREHPLGRDAAIIGRVEGKGRFPAVLESALGVRSILEMPRGEHLPRIC